MKAVDANLLDLLKKSTQYVVPIYQRVYSWQAAECERLWSDVMYAGSHDGLASHFTGSIVYVEREEGTRTSAEPDLIIDGQQRVTTVMLVLAALAERLEQSPEGEREPVEGFSPRKIRNRYLTNDDEDGDQFFKLILSKSDEEALKTIIRQAPRPAASASRVLENFSYFQDKLAEPDLDLVTVCLGLRKLRVVDVSLARGQDNPQLVFETMNSTGKKLSQADLIRNFVLMDLTPRHQRQLYEGFWYPMEQLFAGPYEDRFDEFVRNYLTLKTGVIPRSNDIYDAFKAYAEAIARIGTPRDELVADLHLHSTWYAAMAFDKEQSPRLRRAFHELDQLRATVTYPFLLRVYGDYQGQIITEDDFLDILQLITSYLFRRSACRIPTNSLNRTFASLRSSIDTDHYVTSVGARFAAMSGNARFPKDEEFTQNLETIDFYHFTRAPYFFRRLENEGRKEAVPTSEYTIEHIMPQNPELSSEWRSTLGEDWRAVQEQHLHTLGNLTLTGYNSEYSDRPFLEKRDMKGGFRHSPLRLNEGLAELDTWDGDEIEARGRRLADRAVAVWPYPNVSDADVAAYRDRNRGGFDWSLMHSILEQLPRGNWTSYHDMAQAVGTAAQAVGYHLSSGCSECVNPYRVLNKNGRVAANFAWSDDTDIRDPQELLEVEGVRFEGTTAEPSQLLTSEDLLALVEDS